MQVIRRYKVRGSGGEVYFGVEPDGEEGPFALEHLNEHEAGVEGELERRVVGQQVHGAAEALEVELLLAVQRAPPHLLHPQQPTDLLLLLPVSHLQPLTHRVVPQPKTADLHGLRVSQDALEDAHPAELQLHEVRLLLLRSEVLLADHELLIVLVAVEALPEELRHAQSSGVGEEEAGLVDVQVEDVFVILEHDGDGCEVVEGVFVEGGLFPVVEVAGEELALEQDGDEDVLGRGHELQLHAFARADQEEELHALQVLRREVLEDLPDGLGSHLRHQARRLALHPNIIVPAISALRISDNRSE
jgi:hypothetical protein